MLELKEHSLIQVEWGLGIVNSCIQVYFDSTLPKLVFSRKVSLVNSGIGIDIVDLQRFRRIFANPTLRKKYFSDDELVFSIQSLAARFAAKEAFYKAIENKEFFKWEDIEILRNSDGSPQVILHNNLRVYCKDKRVHLSLSHSPDYAIAFVLIESELNVK
jgi:holo-[acyl-carrier protein] synthase